MATSTRKPKKAANGYVLPDDKLKQRELAFAIYRDMGISRSMHRLQQEFAKEHPALAVSRGSLENWSRKHDWAARVKAHDDAVAKGRAQGVLRPGVVAAPEFDQIGALLSAANQALTRAMSAAPIVTKPSDVKALVDAAAHALKLVETIKAQSSGKVSAQDVANEVARILGEVEKARLADIEQMVEAELKRRGITLDATGAVEEAQPAVPGVEAIDVDTGTPEELKAAEAELERQAVDE